MYQLALLTNKSKLTALKMASYLKANRFGKNTSILNQLKSPIFKYLQ
jgi:hypothetical protein